MELDPKIKIKKIFDVFSDIEEVKKYYGKEVYCADFIENFSNLKLYTIKRKLKNSFPQECKPFLCGGQQYRFILPCEFVEQKKQYRPYTLNEFLQKIPIGKPIIFRQKGTTKYEKCLIINGYSCEDWSGLPTPYICIGNIMYSLDSLFIDYEYKDDYTEDFKPFGVEVEE